MINKDSKPLNKPWKTPGENKKYAVVVMDPKTKTRKVVRFGDPKMKDYLQHHDADRRKNFKARHRCASDPKAKDKTRPKYWSCHWSW